MLSVQPMLRIVILGRCPRCQLCSVKASADRGVQIKTYCRNYRQYSTIILEQQSGRKGFTRSALSYRKPENVWTPEFCLYSRQVRELLLIVIVSTIHWLIQRRTNDSKSTNESIIRWTCDELPSIAERLDDSQTMCVSKLDNYCFLSLGIK